MNGGYQIIDLKNKNHTVGTGMVHEGIYDLIEGTRKPILLKNVVIAGTEYHDAFVNLSVSGSTFNLYFMIGGTTGYKVSVADTDVVTITEQS